MPPGMLELGLISGASGILQGIFGSAGSSYAADRAYEANERTNEMNYRIWQEQQQHNIDMFNMENEANIQNWRTQFDAQNAYNSPIEQVRRLREAGLNPALANVNQASTSAISSANAHPAQAPQMQMPSDVAFQSPLSSFGQGLLNGLSNMATVLGQLQDTGQKIVEQPIKFEGLKLDNQIKQQDIYVKRAQWQKLWIESDLADQEYQFRKNTNNLREKILGQQSQMFDATITQMNLSNHAQKIMNDWLPYEKQLQVITGIQNLELMKQQGLINEETCRNLQVQRVKMFADIKYVDKQTEVASAQKNLLIYEGERVQEETKALKISNKEAESLLDEILLTQKTSFALERASNEYQYRLYNPETWYDYGRSFFHEVGEYGRGALGGLLSGSFDAGKPFQSGRSRPIGFRIK